MLGVGIKIEVPPLRRADPLRVKAQQLRHDRARGQLAQLLALGKKTAQRPAQKPSQICKIQQLGLFDIDRPQQQRGQPLFEQPAALGHPFFQPQQHGAEKQQAQMMAKPDDGPGRSGHRKNGRLLAKARRRVRWGHRRSLCRDLHQPPWAIPADKRKESPAFPSPPPPPTQGILGAVRLAGISGAVASIRPKA